MSPETALMLAPPAGMASYLPPIDPEVLNRALMTGDLAQLAPEERQTYYLALCYTSGINPLTRPFQVIKNDEGALVWYIGVPGAEQLRKLHRVSVRVLERRTDPATGLYGVSVRAWLPSGRSEEAEGWVPVVRPKGTWRTNEKTGRRYFEEAKSHDGEPIFQPLRGKELADAYHRAESKAKRRVTLALCGLGLPEVEEGEVLTYDPVTGEIFDDTHRGRVTPVGPGEEAEGALDPQAAIGELFDRHDGDPRSMEVEL